MCIENKKEKNLTIDVKIFIMPVHTDTVRGDDREETHHHRCDYSCRKFVLSNHF